MNLDTIKPALITLFGTLSELTTVWEDEPRPYSLGALTLLSYTAISSLGHDEVHRKQDLDQPQGQELADQHRGIRLATLTIKVESMIQTDTGSAYWYLERIRERLPFRGTLEALRAVNCALVRAGTTVDLTAALDDRQRSIAALDVTLSVRTDVDDPTRYGYIATVGKQDPSDPPVNITGTLTG
jgi:hypothetical protein